MKDAGQRERFGFARGCQRAATKKLHHEVRRTVGQLTEIADVDDVLIADLRGALRFLTKASHDLLVLGYLVPQHLDRQRLAQRGVHGFVHDAHPALAEHRLDAVAAIEHLTN